MSHKKWVFAAVLCVQVSSTHKFLYCGGGGGGHCDGEVVCLASDHQRSFKESIWCPEQCNPIIISPSAGDAPGPIWRVCVEMWSVVLFIYTLVNIVIF